MKVYCFGTFEIAPDRGELRKAGMLIRLAPQPFRVLVVLVERAGEVVGREEIRELLWGSGEVSVAFDMGMNRCIRQIRAALSDSADQPRYVETLARRGYRLIAPVQMLKDEPGASDPAPPQSNRLLETASAISQSPKSKAWRNSLIVSGVLTLATIAAVVLLSSRRTRVSSEWDIVPLAVELRNQASPAFSPDGRQVAFVWNGETQNHFEIYKKFVGSPSSPLRLTNDNGVNYGPAWSPDGKWIAFCRGSSNPGGAVLIVSAQGGKALRIANLDTTASPGNRSLAWLPDSKSLIVSDRIVGKPKGLSIVDIASGNSRRITEPSIDQFDLNPSVSPNGRQVAFIRDVGRGVSFIMILSLHDGASHLLPSLAAENFKTVFMGGPVWTPDGGSILFESNAGGKQHFWLTSVQGSDAPRDLAALGDHVNAAAISSTGELAFARRWFDSNIWKVTFSRFPERSVLSSAPVIASTRFDDSPALSPDNRRIAFASNRSGWEEIWISDVDGSNAHPITFLKSPGTGSPDWSPDGRTLAFDSRVEGRPQIYTIAADGGAPKKFSAGGAVNVVPRYSPDGKWLYYSSDRTGTMEVWRSPLSGGAPQRMTQHGGFAPTLSRDGKFLFYATNNENLAELNGMNLAESTESTIESLVPKRAYAVAPGGLLFFAHATGNAWPSLQFYSSQEEKTTNILNLSKPAGTGMSMATDGGALYFTQIDQDGSELLLARDFWRR